MIYNNSICYKTQECLVGYSLQRKAGKMIELDIYNLQQIEFFSFLA